MKDFKYFCKDFKCMVDCNLLGNYCLAEFEEAKDFVNALRLSNERWSNHYDWKCEWIFRGQANAGWGLIPSAWRNDAFSDFRAAVAAKKINTVIEGNIRNKLNELKKSTTEYTLLETNIEDALMQAWYEIAVVLGFAELADKVGHPAPEKSTFTSMQTVLCNFFEQLKYSPPCIPEIFNRANQIFALAQHHGIPTRLLDWTRDPLFAAFFAAESYHNELKCPHKNYENKNNEDKIAVWALHRPDVDEVKTRDEGKVKTFTAPRNSFEYLHAQAGLFTYIPGADKYYIEKGEWPTVEQTLEPSKDDNRLRKLTLPAKKVPELLNILWIEKISRAHLMPTYDNISKSLSQKDILTKIIADNNKKNETQR